MLIATINSGAGEVDYTRYVLDGSINIQRSLNTPSTCTLSLSNYDSGFTLPAQRSYLKIFSTLYNRVLYSGFLVNDPNYTFLDKKALPNGPPTNPPAPTPSQLFQYDLNFTSDEYLLQLKSVAFIPAFVNQTQGQILTTIAETLCPGYFNTDAIASGQLVPYLLYAPTTSWSEYAKQFGDASNYRYSCVNKEIHFQPYGDGSLGITYDETKGQGSFDPRLLTTQSMTNPIVNDVTVVGSQEAGNNHEDYFMGDGFTGTFPLKHQVFNAGGTSGTSQGSSGTVLLADAWSETDFNAQMWNVFDPTSACTLVDNALNVITNLNLTYGESYISAYNGLELAGGIVMQHGEFVFNASSTGIVGGVYDDATLNPNTCETGYLITPTPTVTVTASGASGISIQPYRQGAVPAKGFQVVTEINHTYVLSTIVSSPSPVRYTQIYSTLGGSVFGGESIAADVMGNITWQVQDTDIFTGVINTLTFAVSGVILPSFAIYALINNVHLNLSVTATQLYTPPQGTLHICSEIGAGLLVPVYISGNQQYTGAYVTPSGGNLPILPGELGPEQQWPLGSSLQNQSAEIDIGTTVSALSFYSNDLPGVGTRIRLQTWESQAAVSRVVDMDSVQTESQVCGDDGHRSAIITNLNPLPRTSEDADAAAQAYLADYVGNFYQGQYTASYLFFKQNTNDIDFYPVPGRYLIVNAPQRGLNKQPMLVASVTHQIIEMKQEIMNHVISYGPDYHLEKVLENFVSQPVNVLLPQDTVVQPLPQILAQLGTYYLPDVASSAFDTLQITGPNVTLILNDPLPETNSYYELRSADLNWGQGGNYLLGQFFGNQTVVLPRAGFEQIWYLRFIYNDPAGRYTAISRRSKVLRLYWPQIPSVPAYLYADSSTINCDFNGDIRNIEGIELRDANGEFVFYDGIVGSEFDMMLNLDSLRGSISAGASVIGGPIGTYMKGEIPIGGVDITQTLPPTTITQLSQGGAIPWVNPQRITDQGTTTYAQLYASGSTIFTQAIAPILLENFKDANGNPFDVPSDSRILDIVVNLQAGTPVGNVQACSLTVQLTLSGIPIGIAQTESSILWPNKIGFLFFDSESSDTPWSVPVTAENLPHLGVLLSGSITTGATLPPHPSQGFTLVNEASVSILYIAVPQRTFNVYFFNLMWEYSTPLTVTIPPPDKANATVGYRWGPSLQVNIGSTTRTDILYTTLQLATSSGTLVVGTGITGSFNNAGQDGLFYQAQTNGAPASFAVNVPVTGDIYARAQFVDHIGAGDWSDVIYIPKGDLIASDYLSAQGSVPPTITNGNLGSGGVIAYSSFNNSSGILPDIAMSSSVFDILYPNSHIDIVAALYQTFTMTVDTNEALVNSTPYAFFPCIINPTSANPTMNFNGPYKNYTGTLSALQQQFIDGAVPLTNGPFIATTAMQGIGNTSGGGGGGTGGGGNCAASDRYIELHNGRLIALNSLHPGMRVRTPSGKGAVVLKTELFKDMTVRLLTASGLNTRCGYGHVLKTTDGWKSVEELIEDYSQARIWTDKSDVDRVVWVSEQKSIAEICRLHLDGDEHIYMVDGMWCHNTLIKNGS